MKEYADLLLRSMVARDPGLLPLAGRYAATENSVAASLNMMSAWRTVTGIKAMGQCIVDRPAGVLLLTANLDEGGSSTFFCARLKVAADELTELEMYNVRSRSDSGFMLLADEVGAYPEGWTSAIPAGGRATREELYELGRALFDASRPAPESSPDCVLMENGGVVLEDPYYLDLLMTGQTQDRPAGGKVPIPAGLGPTRPSDPDARVVAVDEEQGVVVAVGLVPGFVSPYVIPGTTESCFVPDSMIEMHRRTLDPAMFAGRHVLVEMPAVAVTVQMVRMHSAKVQGIHLIHNLQGPGGGTPWVAKG